MVVLSSDTEQRGKGSLKNVTSPMLKKFGEYCVP
ncbi:hypothetical protein A2U01_0075981, partial [Trifolium medium]|nr:hypothetical protein [Trifolium medium]